jgi:hypothetical protein
MPPVRWWPAVACLLLALFLAYGEGLVGWRAIDGAAWVPYIDPLYAPGGPATAPGVAFDATPGIYNQPWDTLAWRLLRGGELPLWQGFSAFGIPLLGSGQSCPYNPFKLLLASGATGLPEAWYLVARIAFGGLGMLLFARRLGLGPFGAALAGLVFMFNGSFTYRFQLSDTSAWVMLPWLLWAGEALLERPGARTAAWLGLAIGFTGLMGHPEPAVFAAVAAAASVLAGLARPGVVRGKVLLALAGGGLLGVGVAACTLLPFAELVGLSQSYLSDARSRAQELAGYTLAFKAQLLGLHLFSATARMPPFNFNSFVGAVALALAPLGLAHREARRVALVLVAAMAAIVLVCPPGQHLAVLPIAPNSFYATVLLTSAFALLGGAGLDAVAAGRGSRDALVAALVVAVVAWRFHLRAQAIAPTYGDFRACVVAALACSLATLVATRFPRPGAALIAGVAAAELLWGARVANPPQPRFAYAETPITSYLRAQPGPFRVTGGARALIPHTNLMHGLESLDAIEVFFSRRYIAFMRALLLDDHPINGTWGLEGPFLPDLLDLANVRYLLVPDDHPLAGHLPGYPERVRQAHVTLYENPHAMPRAWVAYAADFVPADPAAAGRRLAATPARWRDHVLLETADGQAPAGWQDAISPAGEVAVLAHADQAVDLQANLPRPGWLVLSDAYYPGWQAEVDGRPAEILPADVAFRAVRLEAGSHHVSFRYRPASAARGLALSLAALVLTGLLLRPRTGNR